MKFKTIPHDEVIASEMSSYIDIFENAEKVEPAIGLSFCENNAWGMFLWKLLVLSGHGAEEANRKLNEIRRKVYKYTITFHYYYTESKMFKSDAHGKHMGYNNGFKFCSAVRKTGSSDENIEYKRKIRKIGFKALNSEADNSNINNQINDMFLFDKGDKIADERCPTWCPLRKEPEADTFAWRPLEKEKVAKRICQNLPEVDTNIFANIEVNCDDYNSVGSLAKLVRLLMLDENYLEANSATAETRMNIKFIKNVENCGGGSTRCDVYGSIWRQRKGMWKKKHDSAGDLLVRDISIEGIGDDAEIYNEELYKIINKKSNKYKKMPVINRGGLKTWCIVRI